MLLFNGDFSTENNMVLYMIRNIGHRNTDRIILKFKKSKLVRYDENIICDRDSLDDKNKARGLRGKRCEMKRKTSKMPFVLHIHRLNRVGQVLVCTFFNRMSRYCSIYN